MDMEDVSALWWAGAGATRVSTLGAATSTDGAFLSLSPASAGAAAGASTPIRDSVQVAIFLPIIVLLQGWGGPGHGGVARVWEWVPRRTRPPEGRSAALPLQRLTVWRSATLAVRVSLYLQCNSNPVKTGFAV